MDIVFWIILVVVIAVIVWWLLKRNKSANSPGGTSAGARTDGTRADGALEGGSAAASAAAAGTTGIPTAAGFGKAAEPAPPVTAEEPAESSASSAPPARPSAPAPTEPADEAAGHGVSGTATSPQDNTVDEAAGQGEWETQWSEAGAGPRSGSSVTGAAAAPPQMAAQSGAGADAPSGQAIPAASQPVHHDEYTAPHAPTLPGAETAAVEGVDDGGTAAGGLAGSQAPQHRADNPGSVNQHQPSGQGQDFAQEQTTAAAEPAGHLAADEPYGAGSAAAGPDGSGPSDYTVKGDAAAMVYYEEGHPDYEQTRAEVWFESAAHAEAAGFRAPRRKRL